jgi:hypothetical protein
MDIDSSGVTWDLDTPARRQRWYVVVESSTALLCAGDKSSRATPGGSLRLSATTLMVFHFYNTVYVDARWPVTLDGRLTSIADAHNNHRPPGNGL